MANLTNLATTVVIDGCEPVHCDVEITQDYEMVRSLLATKPDPQWEHTDSNAHFHAYARDGELPTLREEIVELPCDGSCGGVCDGEGYTRPEYHCVLCDEVVEPGRKPDYEAQMTGVPVATRKQATVTVHGGPEHGRGAKVSLRVLMDGSELIGVGDVVRIDAIHDSSGVERTTTIAARFLEPRMAQ